MSNDYELQHETVHMLRLFHEGSDNLERGLDAEPPLDQIAEVLCQMNDEQKGIVIIDLLTLFCELESRVIRARAMEMMSDE